MLTLCTLFDHNYLDKGLAMYGSLERVCKDFELYVLAMSDRCYEILTDLNYPHIKPIKLVDFEDEELLKVKPTRKVGEYCWTCTASLIRYVLLNFKPDYCAYIDSDLYFYSDPSVVIEEMKERHASVQITGHRFNESNKHLADTVGRYCVEYNTFKNDEKALGLLEIWRNQCLEQCSSDNGRLTFGDQKYLDNWCEDYEFVIETRNLGAGVAPWNLTQYRLFNKYDTRSLVFYATDEIIPLVFYHFQNLEYLDEKHAKMNIDSRNRKVYKLARILYREYLKELRSIKSFLKDSYGIDVLLKQHPAFETNNLSFFEKIIKILRHPSELIDKYGSITLRALTNRQIISF